MKLKSIILSLCKLKLILESLSVSFCYFKLFFILIELFMYLIYFIKERINIKSFKSFFKLKIYLSLFGLLSKRLNSFFKP